MSNPSPIPKSGRSSCEGYEKRDANAKWIFATVAFLFVSVLIVHFCLAGMLERFEKKPTPRDSWSGARTSSVFTAELKGVPQLQLVPEEDLRTFRQREDAELNTYGWIDRTSGVVRIPVDRAMNLIAERGLPARSQTNETRLGPSSYDLQQRRPFAPQPEIQDAP